VATSHEIKRLLQIGREDDLLFGVKPQSARYTGADGASGTATTTTTTNTLPIITAAASCPSNQSTAASGAVEVSEEILIDEIRLISKEIRHLRSQLDAADGPREKSGVSLGVLSIETVRDSRPNSLGPASLGLAANFRVANGSTTGQALGRDARSFGSGSGAHWQVSDYDMFVDVPRSVTPAREKVVPAGVRRRPEVPVC
jgi:hypothetical protein